MRSEARVTQPEATRATERSATTRTTFIGGAPVTQAPSGRRWPPRNPEQRRLIELKLRGSNADKPPKHAGEMAWIRKSRDSGRVQDCAPRITQRNLCPFDSLVEHITVRRATHASLEQLRKMVGAHTRQFSEVGQADIFR